MSAASIDEDRLNMQIRKFLKKVGITSQREIEKAVREAADSGKLAGDEKLPVRMHLTVSGLDVALDIDGEIELG